MTKTFKQLSDVIEAIEPEPLGKDCPSWRRLDQWRFGELSAHATAELEAHVSTCADCQRRLNAEAEAFRDLPGGSSELIEPIIRRASRRTPPVSALRWTTGALAAAAIALLAFIPQRSATTAVDPAGQVTRKGGKTISFTVFREHQGHVTKLNAGGTAAPNDRLRFEISVPAEAEIMIFGTEATGQRFAYYPADGQGRSVRHTKQDSALLDGAIELDSSLGRESIALIACTSPFELSALTKTPPKGCQIASIEFQKVVQ